MGRVYNSHAEKRASGAGTWEEMLVEETSIRGETKTKQRLKRLISWMSVFAVQGAHRPQGCSPAWGPLRPEESGIPPLVLLRFTLPCLDPWNPTLLVFYACLEPGRVNEYPVDLFCICESHAVTIDINVLFAQAGKQHSPASLRTCF